MPGKADATTLRPLESPAGLRGGNSFTDEPAPFSKMPKLMRHPSWQFLSFPDLKLLIYLCEQRYGDFYTIADFSPVAHAKAIGYHANHVSESLKNLVGYKLIKMTKAGRKFNIRLSCLLLTAKSKAQRRTPLTAST